MGVNRVGHCFCREDDDISGGNKITNLAFTRGERTESVVPRLNHRMEAARVELVEAVLQEGVGPRGQGKCS